MRQQQITASEGVKTGKPAGLIECPTMMLQLDADTPSSVIIKK